MTFTPTYNLKKKKAVLYIRNVPQDTKALFKAWCARRGITLTQGIIEMMKHTVQGEEDESNRLGF